MKDFNLIFSIIARYDQLNEFYNRMNGYILDKNMIRKYSEL